MIWLLGGYMWLFVHRPFEVWPSLGSLQIERAYMLFMMLVWVVWPGKQYCGNRIHAGLVAFTIAMGVTWLLSPYTGMPGCTDVIENYAKVAVFYFLVITTVRDERQLRLLVLMFVGAVGLYMAHSMLEFINGRYQWRMGIRRMIGVDITFADPNAFATTLLYSLPMTLPFWYEKPRRIPRILLVSYALGVTGCVLLTGSRAGLIGLVSLGAIILMINAKHKLQMALMGGLGAMVGGLVLLVALPQELQDRYLTLVDSSKGPQNAQTSAEGRMDGLVYGLQVWQQSPMFGHGPASFPYSTGRGGHAHNLYGQVLSEMGLMGAIALTGLVVCFVLNWMETRRLARAVCASPPTDFPYHVSRAVIVNIALLLLMGCAGHNLYRYNWQWFAAFQAVAVYCLRQRAVQSGWVETGSVQSLPELTVQYS